MQPEPMMYCGSLSGGADDEGTSTWFVFLLELFLTKRYRIGLFRVSSGFSVLGNTRKMEESHHGTIGNIG